MQSPRNDRSTLKPRRGNANLKQLSPTGMWAYGTQIVASALLATNEFAKGLNDGWNIGFFCLFAAWFLLSAGQVLHMLHVRRNDAPFWDEEDLRRADLERRGRRL